MRARWLAAGLGLVCVLVGGGAVLAAVASGWSFDQALDAFVLSNVVIGVSFGLCGALLAWHRPLLPLGWLYAGGGSARPPARSRLHSPRCSTTTQLRSG